MTTRAYATRSRRSTGPRAVCPDCGRRGMTRWTIRADAIGPIEVRYCRYCQRRDVRPVRATT